MNDVKKSGLSLVRHGVMMLTAMVAVLTMFGIGHTFAYQVDTGDFTVSYSEVYGSNPKEYEKVEVSKYKGSSPDVVLPATVTINGTEVPIPTIGSSLFKRNSGIRSVTFPEGYVTVPVSAFEKCTGLETVTISGSITHINSYAFENCTGLKNVNFAPDTAAELSIGTSAFKNCTSLQSVTLPARLSDVADDNNIFINCTALTSISMAEGAKNYAVQDNMLFHMLPDGAAMAVYPAGAAAASVTLPAEVNGKPMTALGAMVMRYNTTVTEVTIPASVNRIERMALEGCTNLKTIHLLGETAPTLNSSCFNGIADGSTIYVANDSVAAALNAKPDEYTTFYDPAKTTVVVDAPAPVTVSAGLSLEAAGVQDNAVKFDLYLDNASCAATVVAKVTFDPAQLEQGSVVLAGDVFQNVTPDWTQTGAVKLMFNCLSDGGYTGAERVKLATLTLNRKAGVVGELSATLAKAECAGIPDAEAPAVAGTTTINNAKATVFVARYDVNGDKTVDQVDITEAQRYYQAVSADSHWNTARIADVNNAGKVDLQDLIDIFLHLTDF